MRITEVEVAYVSVPLPAPRGLSGGPITASTDTLVRITAGDLQGIGECRGWTMPVLAQILDELVLLLGEDPFETDRIRTRLRTSLLQDPKPHQRAVISAIGAVDLALWDIKARAAGVSVAKLLGGTMRPIRAYIAGGFYTEGHTLEQTCEELVGEIEAGGYRAAKVRVGQGSVEDDEARVRAIREAIGPDLGLSVELSSPRGPSSRTT